MGGIRQITAVLQLVVLQVVVVPLRQVVLPPIRPLRSRLPQTLRRTRPAAPGVVVTKVRVPKDVYTVRSYGSSSRERLQVSSD